MIIKTEKQANEIIQKLKYKVGYKLYSKQDKDYIGTIEKIYYSKEQQDIYIAVRCYNDFLAVHNLDYIIYSQKNIKISKN